MITDVVASAECAAAESIDRSITGDNSQQRQNDYQLHFVLRLSGYFWLLLVFCVSASEMTYIVSSGALNSTHSLTCVLCTFYS